MDDFRIFGIDPSATADDGSLKGDGGGGQTELQNDDVESSEHAHASSAEGTHDRIPFTGRLLTSEFVFRYKADIDGADGEEYERICRLPLAVSIVPAVTVSAWHVLPGDSSMTRYVVVDVTNSTEWDAELTYGKGKIIGVQPREICREVASNAFQEAASRASHMMQMHEMERLRLVLERHVSAHLDITWSINHANLCGSVPIGPILSSIALLKQLVVPAISIGYSLLSISTPLTNLHFIHVELKRMKLISEMSVDGIPCVREDDIAIGIGEILELQVKLICSIKGLPFYSVHITSTLLNDLLFASSYEVISDVQNDDTFIDSNDNVIVLNNETVPFRLARQNDECADEVNTTHRLSVENDYAPNASLKDHRAFSSDQCFTFTEAFRYLQIEPAVTLLDGSSQFSDEELFYSAVSVNVITKV
ncbi:unnamed protein product [Anisakis simplex]|uniref:Trafficking protein particle complex subunit 9 (inferred by orthology to a human protein) n=1 Tax=Anisakis simplex TaxID=6269 RepID=A0A0M3K840_ANISI|nr:unnamed protein product [Anisakis simplex]